MRLTVQNGGALAVENRPKTPGIAVANHLSINDIIVLCSNVHKVGELFSFTGQRHKGFLGKQAMAAIIAEQKNLKAHQKFRHNRASC